MKTKLVAIAAIALMMLGFLAAIPIKPASATLPTALRVQPTAFSFNTATDPVGTTFHVYVYADVVTPDTFFGWEFVLAWTPGVVNCVGETLNFGIWGAGNFLGPWVPVPINNGIGEYHQSLTGKAPGAPVSGTFLLTDLTFQIVAEPGYGETITTNFHLQIAPGYIAYCLLDGSSNEIVHSYTDATYEYAWSAPTTNAHIEVVYTGEPGVHDKVFGGKNIYKTPFSFSVDVTIEDVVPGWGLAGTEFLLYYNTAILDVLSITEGTFFDPFCDYTFFYQYDDVSGWIRVAYTMLDYDAAPFGSGTLATIVFNATYQEQFPNSVYSDFGLAVDVPNGMTSYFVNFLADEIPYDPAVNGSYTLAGYVVGRVIDLYTQYPDPFGGQGPQMPSDMFWPQKEVELYANITYNEWPVQNKLVAYEVRGPSGQLIDILTAVSDEYGVAHLTYRIPWPCDDPESLFGVWTITATVDIACIVVNDTLQFHFDYLVHWYGGGDYKVTTDKAEYGHCEYINATITFGSHSQMPRWVLLTLSIHDELNYPIGTAYVWVQVGGTVFCQLKNYTETLSIHVIKWAAAGVAKLYFNAYSDWPALGGSPWAPTFEPIPEVNILATWA